MVKFSVLAMLATTAIQARAATEEQRLLQIAKQLKPMSDSQWNEIAGSKITDTYEIVKGDTLWDISKRLFGNSYYWPKVWAFNNDISNPHIVSPGQKLVFNSGSSNAAPSLSPNTASPEGSSTAESSSTGQTATDAPPSNPGAHEYEKLPKSRYAPVKLGTQTDTKNYDKWGFDRELKLTFANRSSFRVPSIANDTTIPYLGEIVGSRREGEGLSQGETVFLKSNSQDLQVGTTYTVFNEPEQAHERKSDRSGYIYRSAGEVKIVGVKDELYVGVIIKSYEVITRGMRVYPLLPLVTELKPVPARTALESLVLLSSAENTRNTGQFRFVHFDRGIEDGVQIGNVFRIYDYFDPISRKKLTDADFLINADAIVIHATAQFSTAVVLRSSNTFTRGDFAVLLTDISDIEKKITDNSHEFAADKKENEEDKELDELDELDKSSGEGLGRKEEAEIKELDQWDKNKEPKPGNGESTVPSAPDVPTDEAEKLPGSTMEPPSSTAPKDSPKDPTLDQALDSPVATPQGLETKEPPAHLRQAPEQTLEAPPPPTSPDELPPPGDPSATITPEPITPPVEPALPAPGPDPKP